MQHIMSKKRLCQFKIIGIRRFFCRGRQDLFYLGLITELVYRIYGNESLRVGLFHEIHQLAVFVFIDDRYDLGALGSVIRTKALVESRAAVEIVEQIGNDLVVVGLRNDADTALDIESEDKFIDDHSAEIRTEDAENDGFRIVADRGRKRNDESRDRDRGSKLHLQMLIHDLGDDIESAR